MKKLFSIFAALTLCVGLWAEAPVAQKAQVANLNQLSATPELKVINQEAKAKIGPKDMAAQSRSVVPRKGYTTTYNYKCGPTEVVVTDLSTPTYSQFKLTITQKAKNTSEYNKETLYDNTVELILDPDEHSIVGTFTTDDYSIDANSFLKSGSNKRYVSYWENSTITIVSKGGNKYAITDGLLQVESSNGNYLYKYNYCYAAADLNNQDAEKTAFEFTFGEEPTPAPEAGDQFEDATSGLKFEVTAVGETNTVKVTFNNDYTGSTCTVPATVKYRDVDFAVTEIGEGAFLGYSALTSITLPESVTTIGIGAFKTTGLTSITIPANVTTIGGAAFLGCSGLQSITIPAGVTTIEESTFYGCMSLSSITLTEGLTTIGATAFVMSGLISIAIPASVTTIGEGAFANCASLASVTFLGNACQEGIADDAFGNVGDPDLALLTLPNSWTGTLPDENGNWYGGKFEMSSIPTALPSLPYEGKVGKGSFKFFHNGQLIIRKGNKAYNAVGTEL